MATINDLYLKYVEEVGKHIEDDRYFRYLYEMVQAGDNLLSQQHQVLHKVVDERWLATIEEALEPLNRIIEKPRRFIERKEEVVPVALAKKITADSVRHLSQNTQFIASYDGEQIQPTHILNVTVDESYDLYENRFIYYLIQRLVTFVDKRTDVIFWSTSDETQDTLSLESKVDDAYERIEYRVEMKIRNLQNTMENDSDNMKVFMRIDRVRRLVMTLKNSSFCEIMAGCQQVHSPIQRTNLLTKDPDYRVCYQLWQFLESYDEVGYTIEAQNSALEFDEEYLIQLYTNLIANYAVFKSITEGEPRELDETKTVTRNRTIRPRFVKEIVEEIADSYDINETEYRRVFVDEVTQAQLDAEARLEEEKKAREAAEEALNAAEASARHAMNQVEFIQASRREAEDQAEAISKRLTKAEQDLQQEKSEKENLYLELQKKDELLAVREEQLGQDRAALVQQLESEHAAYEARLEDMTAQYEQHEKDLQEEFDARMEKLEYAYMDKMNTQEENYNAELESLQIKNEQDVNQHVDLYEAQLKKQAQSFQQQLEEKLHLYEETSDKQREAYRQNLQIQRDGFESRLKEKDQAHAEETAKQEEQHQAALDQLRKDHTAALSAQRAEAAKQLNEEKARGDQEIAEVKEQAADYIRKLNDKHSKDMDALRESSRRELSRVKEESLKEKQTAADRYEQLKQESESRYSDLKNTSDAALRETQSKARTELADQRRSAAEKESELSAAVARLESELKALRSENAGKDQKLQELETAKNIAEAKAAQEADLRKALEEKDQASSVAEFRAALHKEKKTRRKWL